MDTKNTFPLKVTRKFKVPAKPVFDAFLNPELAGKFMFATPTGTMVRAEIDPKVGGHFNFTDRRGEEDVAHTGEYLEILRPKRLVFTLRVEKYSQDTDKISISIENMGEESELTLIHELSSKFKEMEESVKSGWTEILEKLAELLGDPTAKKQIPTALVSYHFDAPIKNVFEAWLDPEQIGEFMFGPKVRPNEEVLRIQMDPNVGGDFSFLIRREDAEIDHIGKYLEIVPPHRLAFTWGTADDQSSSRVTIDFLPVKEGCELILKHELDFEWADFVERCEESWRKMIKALDQNLKEGNK
ncbi:hypothetical protein CH373_06560 [Leptospira perolatii]|uniref:Activator of Hsp90 ATPase homologue 1/2-like C-terminal domain-containing protein n=1 Tax=Leptospira perolatii TaxID=2023191 RepID=A0A2M9ZP85_9LEPT|nr:SRPBCC family protein [Leptospira perolatii]PJZ70603.1 hypothetical protein CH360_03420 [Leptospira perolatii]PJZ73815.1 hypothetical protein CH373_06560 [Leptospira perolatii]